MKNLFLFSDEKIRQALNDKKAKAKDLLSDSDKMEYFLQQLEKKLRSIPKVGAQLADLPILVSLVRAYISKEYTAIPINSVIGVAATLLYVFIPTDLIPDFIPGLGYVDDIAVVGFTVNGIHKDLQAYKEWRNSKA